MATQDRLPTGIGANDSWLSINGVDKWLEVDDPVGTSDNNATYVFRTDRGAQTFSGNAFDISSAIINKLTITLRVRKISSSATITFSARIRVNGATYNHPTTHTADTFFQNFTSDWTTNPATGAAWTEADIEGTGSNPFEHFGIRLNTVSPATAETRCTQMYATVDYLEAFDAILPPIPTPQHGIRRASAFAYWNEVKPPLIGSPEPWKIYLPWRYVLRNIPAGVYSIDTQTPPSEVTQDAEDLMGTILGF